MPKDGAGRVAWEASADDDRAPRCWQAIGLALAAQLEAVANLGVALRLGGGEVIQVFAALGDHFEQAAPGSVVFRVFGEVGGEVVDALGEERGLNGGTAGVAFVHLIGLDVVGHDIVPPSGPGSSHSDRSFPAESGKGGDWRWLARPQLISCPS